MVSTRLYTAIYVVLFVSATVQVPIRFAGLSYWLAFGVIMVLSAAKTVLIAAYFQHLRLELRSLMHLVCIGLATALAFTLAVPCSLL